MKLNDLLSRWSASRAAHAAPQSHGDWNDTSKAPAADSIWQSLRQFKNQVAGLHPKGAAKMSQAEDAQFDTAKTQFRDALGDIDSRAADVLRYHIERARDLTDLWHVRSGLYTELARTLSQFEAQQRLARLQPLFAGRVPSALSHRRTRSKNA